MDCKEMAILVFVIFCILMALALFWFVARDWHRDDTNARSSILPPPPPPRKMNNDEPLFLVVYGNIAEDCCTVYPLDEVLQIEYNGKTGRMRVYYKSDIGYSEKVNEYDHFSHYKIAGASLITGACHENKEINY